MTRIHAALLIPLAASALALAADPDHPTLTWVKRHPQKESLSGKPSPKMGYETSYGYDARTRLLIRYGGHNQGGGGEQNSEVWTYDLDKDLWTLKEPNDSPPGVCCAQQNVFDEAQRKFIRFPAHSGNHGWQSFRELYLKNSSVWTYDLDTNHWRYLRPSPEAWPGPCRGAVWDPHHQVCVLHGGEGASHGTVAYDLYANAWHFLKPATPPPATITQPGFAYDPVHGLYAMFGYAVYNAYKGTWVFDLRKNEWRELAVGDRQPPGVADGPVLAGDARNGIVLAHVKGKEGMETWALDVTKPEWTRLKVAQEADASGSRNRILLYLPDRNLFVLEDRTKDEQQIWTFRYAEAPIPAPAPRELRAETEDAGVRLTWQPPEGNNALRYNVYRGEGERPWEANFARIAEAVATPEYRDAGAKKSAGLFYRVCTVDEKGRESPPSFHARTRPPVVTSLRASVLDAKRIELEWEKPLAPDVAGYLVERADVGVYSTDQVKFKKPMKESSDLAVGRIRFIGAYQRLTPRPVPEPRFVDQTADLGLGQREPQGTKTGGSDLKPQQLNPNGKPYRFAVYAYRVVAVNRWGLESGASPLIFSYPSAPQHVISREEAPDKTRLKWAKNPEQGIRGYIVNRLEGKETDTPIVRLTPEPVAGTEFLDPSSGTATRRYELVAVDALGQEGEPSQPIWSRREWRAFYVPYVGEWHQ